MTDSVCETCIADVLWMVEKTLRDAMAGDEHPRAIEWTITDAQDEDIDVVFAHLPTLHLRVHQHGDVGRNSYLLKERSEALTPPGSPAWSDIVDRWDYSRMDGGWGLIAPSG